MKTGTFFLFGALYETNNWHDLDHLNRLGFLLDFVRFLMRCFFFCRFRIIVCIAQFMGQVVFSYIAVQHMSAPILLLPSDSALNQQEMDIDE